MGISPEIKSSSTSSADERIRKVAYRLICQVMVQDFNIFLGSVGAQKVLSAYQAMGEYAGHAIARNFIRRLDLKGDGADVVAIPMYALTNNIFSTSSDPIEIRERGVEVRTTSCLRSEIGATPEYCVAITHNASIGIVKEINPDYEMIYTHHLAQGDPYCRYVVKRKSDRVGDLNDLGKLLEVLPPIELAESEKETLTTSCDCNIWMNITRAMLEVIGSEDTMAMLDTPSRDAGKKFGEESKRLLNIDNGDARDAELVIEALGLALGQDHKRLEDTTDMVRTEIEGCALIVGPIETCLQFEMLADGICKSIDPVLEFSYEKMRTRGDKTCHWTIRKKGEPAKEKAKGEVVLDDPAKILAIRYAKGEITEEEFDKRMAHLRKQGVVK